MTTPACPKLLLVDDDYASRRLVYFVLDPGIRILEAANGLDALAVAQAERPHLLLVDLRMPGLNGIEVCRHLKARPQTEAIKVVIVTASHEAKDRREARAAGADAYVTKPYRPFELASTVYSLFQASGMRYVASGRTSERWIHWQAPAREPALG